MALLFFWFLFFFFRFSPHVLVQTYDQVFFLFIYVICLLVPSFTWWAEGCEMGFQCYSYGPQKSWILNTTKARWFVGFDYEKAMGFVYPTGPRIVGSSRRPGSKWTHTWNLSRILIWGVNNWRNNRERDSGFLGKVSRCRPSLWLVSDDDDLKECLFADMLKKLSRREKDANIKPDPDLDMYMKVLQNGLT